MKKRIKSTALGLLICIFLTACGSDPEVALFKQEIDTFCTAISEIDTAINNMDAQSEYATLQLLRYLDDLEKEFVGFAELDFPEDYDYLESIADEAATYMTTAVDSYHEVYESDRYDESTAEYAKENYSRAYKRIQIIIALLHGEEIEDVNISISE